MLPTLPQSIQVQGSAVTIMASDTDLTTAARQSPMTTQAMPSAPAQVLPLQALPPTAMMGMAAASDC